MKILLILRHAKSSSDNPQLVDHDRPLNERGIRDASRLGKVLSEEQLVPDLIITSTAKRALDTVSLLVESSGYQNKIKKSKDLYDTDIETHINVLKKLGEDYSSIMIVGHNPTLGEMVNMFSGTAQAFTTANLAKIEFPIDHWKQLETNVKGQLIKLWRPKENP